MERNYQDDIVEVSNRFRFIREDSGYSQENYQKIQFMLDIWEKCAYNSQADMVLKASWIKPDANGGRENNV